MVFERIVRTRCVYPSETDTNKHEMFVERNTSSNFTHPMLVIVVTKVLIHNGSRKFGNILIIVPIGTLIALVTI
jgi:hypothetical protein